MKPNLYIQDIAAYGSDTGHGNLLGIQPYMWPSDYATEGSFRAKLEGYLDVAREQGWLNEKTIVIWPEYLGTWLVASGEWPAVYKAKEISAAMRAIVLHHPLAFLRAVIRAQEQDRIKGALFRMKAPRAAAIYQKVFSTLARSYGVTLVAGSIVLPSPQVMEGKLTIGEGLLYNISVVYRLDGEAHEPLVRKVYPIADELPFTAPSVATDLPVYETPAGRLGVLICADSWYPDTYEVLQAKGAEIVVVPSYLSPDGVWRQPWRGYSGAAAPEDVDSADVGKLSEGEAWLKYALAGRLVRAGIRHGINVFLRGALWDLGSEGHTILVRDRMVIEARQVAGAALVNSWL